MFVALIVAFLASIEGFCKWAWLICYIKRWGCLHDVLKLHEAEWRACSLF